MSATSDDGGALPASVGVAIVGSGFSGLAMAIALLKAGRRDFVVLERADAIGGTWRDNTYPGCACDVPSHLYSFSFAPAPRWSRAFAPQAEIRAYLERCTDTFGVRPFVRFGRAVVEAAFDEASARWTLRTNRGETLTATAVVAGLGGLSNPTLPKIAGASTFAGEQFHSARWNHAYDLRGKRVAVVGTGASAIQFVPAIAPQVAALHLFQRTPPWVLGRPDRAYGARARRWLGASTLLRKAYRAAIYARYEARALGFVGDPRLMSLVAWFGRRAIARAIADPALRAAVTPTYVPGCKRILMSNEWYPTLARPNVEVVTEAIDRIEPHAVVTKDGVAREVDAILWATGFAVQAPLGSLRVRGREGADLGEAWKTGAETYLGITTAGFPNLFFLMGPNTGLGHNSMVYMIESQVRYVLGCLTWQREHGAAFVDVRRDAQQAFVGEMARRLDRAVWASGCTSWYLSEAGRNTTLWPGFTFEYRARTRRFDPAPFEVRRAPGAGASAHAALG